MNVGQQRMRMLRMALLLPTALAFIGPDGNCLINVFAPFTRRNGQTARGLLLENMSSGFSNLVAAVLATKDFNARNATLVPELANLTKCNVHLQIGQVFNTGTNSHLSTRTFLKHLLASNFSTDSRALCAIAGPSHDTPANDLAVMSYAAEVPLVAAYSEDIVRDGNNGLMRTSVFPDMLETTGVLVSYLMFIRRNNFIALLHPLSDAGMQRRSSLGLIFDANGIKWISSEYIHNGLEQDSEEDENSAGLRSVSAAVKRIKDSGYRTIVIAIDHDESVLGLIGNAVEEHGMNNGEYFYLFFDAIHLDGAGIENPNVMKLLRGSGALIPITSDLVDDPTGPLLAGWERLEKEEFESTRLEINELNPIAPGNNGYNHANTTFFNSTRPEYGSAFMYDAVMSIGFGACEAKVQLDGSVNGTRHHQAIRKTGFFGASGDVVFGNSALERGGTRPGRTLNWAAVNYLGYEFPFIQAPDVLWVDRDRNEDKNESDFRISLPFGGFLPRAHWVRTINFTFPDGSHTFEAPLRSPGNPNYLSHGFRTAGLTLMSVTMVVPIVICAWVYFCRKHRVLAASQPAFLYVVCFGTIVQSAAVIAISFDEGAGLTKDQLDALCMAFPWLFILGYMIVVSSLFTKLWRVHKILQFTRQKIKITQIAWPMAFLLSAALFILSLWTALDPLEWERREIDAVTGDSVGTCRQVNGQLAAYLTPLLAVLIAASFLMAYMAYRTKDVDEAYSESQWIFLLIVVELEVVVVSAPILIKLHGEDQQDAPYLVFVMLVLSFPWATLGFIFGPKAVAYLNAVRGVVAKRKRGQHYDTPQVTGLAHPGALNGEPRQETVMNHDSENADIVVDNA